MSVSEVEQAPVRATKEVETESERSREVGSAGGAPASAMEFRSSMIDVDALADEGGEGQTVLQSATDDLGKMEALDEGFYAAGGAVIDGLVPTVGQTGKVELSAEVPLDASGTASAVFTFSAKVARTGKGVKATIAVDFSAGVGQELDLWITTAKVFAKAGVKGSMEALGDSGEEVLRLMALGIRQRIAGLSETVADLVFDRGTIEDTVESMDEKDYVQSVLAGAASAGATLGKKGEDQAGGEVAAEAGIKEKLTKGSSGALEAEHIQYGSVSASVSGVVRDFKVKGTLTGGVSQSEKAGRTGSLQLALSGSAPVEGEEIEDLVTGGSYVADSLSAMGGLVEAVQANVDGEENVRMASSLAKYLVATSGVSTAAQQGAIEAAAELKKLGASVDFTLTAAAAINHKGEPGFRLQLSKTNKFSYEGGARKAKVKVLVSNLQDVINVSAGKGV